MLVRKKEKTAQIIEGQNNSPEEEKPGKYLEQAGRGTRKQRNWADTHCSNTPKKVRQ